MNIDGKKLYRLWAPLNAKWIDWIRPVPFIALAYNHTIYSPFIYEDKEIKYIKSFSSDTAFIIDLPGNKSINEGLNLAKQFGYRPIPIFNGTSEQPGSIPTVNNHEIESGLIEGANILNNINISLDSPPAFLLDLNRTNRYKMNLSIFDNSWDIYHQDFPTVNYFTANHINKIIIVSPQKISNDLNKIFYKFPKQGVDILYTDGYLLPKKARLKRPKKKEEDF